MSKPGGGPLPSHQLTWTVRRFGGGPGLDQLESPWPLKNGCSLPKIMVGHGPMFKGSEGDSGHFGLITHNNGVHDPCLKGQKATPGIFLKGPGPRNAQPKSQDIAPKRRRY